MLLRRFRRRLTVRLDFVAKHVVAVVRPARRNQEVLRGGPGKGTHAVVWGIGDLEISVGIRDAVHGARAGHAEGHRDRRVWDDKDANPGTDRDVTKS